MAGRQRGPQKSSRNFVSETGRFRVQISLWLLRKGQSTILALFRQGFWGNIRRLLVLPAPLFLLLIKLFLHTHTPVRAHMTGREKHLESLYNLRSFRNWSDSPCFPHSGVSLSRIFEFSLDPFSKWTLYLTLSIAAQGVVVSVLRRSNLAIIVMSQSSSISFQAKSPQISTSKKIQPRCLLKFLLHNSR